MKVNESNLKSLAGRNKMTKSDIESVIAFIRAVHNACKDAKSDTVNEFICPNCGNQAMAIKSGYNGHHRGECQGCGSVIME